MIKIKHRWTNEVLFKLEVATVKEAVIEAIKNGTDLRGADLSGADLRGVDLSATDLRDCNLSGADLSAFKTDLFDVLLRSTNEIGGLRQSLVEGKVEGSAYKGSCACLLGTLAKVRGCKYTDLGNGILPNSSRPAEQWFMFIKQGDTPETNSISQLTVEWIDEFNQLISEIKS